MFHCFEFRIIKKTLDKTSMQTVQMLLQSTTHTDMLAAGILIYDTNSNSPWTRRCFLFFFVPYKCSCRS